MVKTQKDKISKRKTEIYATLFAIVCLSLLSWLIYRDASTREITHTMIYMQGFTTGLGQGFTRGYVSGFDEGKRTFTVPSNPSQKHRISDDRVYNLHPL